MPRARATSVEVTDYAALVDNVLFNGISPAGSLRDAVAAVIVSLTGSGALTLGAGADGPDVPAFGFSFVQVREALDQLCQIRRLDVADRCGAVSVGQGGRHGGGASGSRIRQTRSWSR